MNPLPNSRIEKLALWKMSKFLNFQYHAISGQRETETAMVTPFPTRTPVPRTLVFIHSENRSGSTWLSYVLGSHPAAAHLGEYYRPFIYENHTACRLCEAKGLAECEVLHGIEHVEKQFAHDFAFQRMRKPILIDSSKLLDWTSQFLDQDRFPVRVIHLIRDPRGWFASERRRTPMSVEAAMQCWLGANRCLKEFFESHELPYFTTFYDELTIQPEVYFPPLCEFLGMTFDQAALQHWNYEHHGLGGNGAAFNVIGRYEKAVIVTGDDSFYKTHAGHSFYDARWSGQLNSDERAAIEQSPEIRQMLGQYGRDLPHFDRLMAGYLAGQGHAAHRLACASS